MMKKKNFSVVFLISFLGYLLPELFFEDSMLYISGGVIGGTILEVFKSIAHKSSYSLVFLVWIALLCGLILLYFHFKYKPTKYFGLLIIAFFLYVVDNIAAFIPIFENGNTQKAIVVNYLVIVLVILLKSIALAWIYCQRELRIKK
jgi:hypothetical protein